jgi:hypothetical protein
MLFARTVTFLVSILSLYFWAYTLSIYTSRIAPTDGVPALDDDSLLTLNSLPIIPLGMSVLWALVHLLLFSRRASRLSDPPTGPPTPPSQPRPLVHPGWEIGVDGTIWVFMLVTTVLASRELGRWRAGDEDGAPGGGHTHVNLADCPVTNPTTGRLEYYCTADWNNLMKFQNVALNLMASEM